MEPQLRLGWTPAQVDARTPELTFRSCGIPVQITRTIGEFLGQPRTVAQACKDAPIFLRRIIEMDEHEPADSVKKYPAFRCWQFNQGMQSAIRAGQLVVVQILLAAFPDLKVSFEAVDTAAASGRRDIIELLFVNHATTIARPAGGGGAPNGDVDEANDEAHVDFEKSHRFVGSALEHGHLELAQWLVPRVNKVSRLAWMQAAVKSGDLEALKWAHSFFGREGSPSSIVNAAAEGGHMEILKWLLEYYDGFVNLGLVASCADYDTIEQLLSFRRGKCFALERALIEAAGRGRLDIVRLLLERDSTICSNAVYVAAAAHGHLELIRWLHDNWNERCTTEVMDAAAGNGHLDLVKWLHGNRAEGCTKAAMDTAAGNGHLEVVKWLRYNRWEGCTTRAMNSAAKKGFLGIVKWLLKYQCEACSMHAVDFAAAEGHLETVKVLVESGTSCTNCAMDDAAANGHLETVKWLHEHGKECTTRAMDQAAKNGHFDMVLWLDSHRTEGCTDAAINLAATCGHLNIVRWLHEKKGANIRGSNVLARALDAGRFDAVVYICMELNGDLLDALENTREQRLLLQQFLDWLYSQYSAQFISSFVEKYRWRWEWEELCSLPGIYLPGRSTHSNSAGRPVLLASSSALRSNAC